MRGGGDFPGEAAEDILGGPVEGGEGRWGGGGFSGGGCSGHPGRPRRGGVRGGEGVGDFHGEAAEDILGCPVEGGGRLRIFMGRLLGTSWGGPAEGG